MERPIVKGVWQVGLYAPDPDRLAEFYQTVLGLQIVAQGKLNPDGIRGSVFLSRQPEAAHDQVAIFADPAMRHTAFQVESLADLRALYQVVIDRDLPIRWTLNSKERGVSMSIEKGKPQVTGLCHVGLYAKNPAAQAEFYQEVMGMQLVGSSGEDNPHPIGQSAFLSSRPDEESHQIAFFDNPKGAYRLQGWHVG